MVDPLPSLPLGQPEGEHLEFKGREALERPERIAREVVAMLNAAGGQVWVGLAEEQGVARRLEPIEDPEAQLDRIWDCLAQRIEPKPRSTEVTRHVVPVGGDFVILIAVEAGSRGPYALLDRGSRAFLRRLGRRVVEMSREELAQAFSAQPRVVQENPLRRAKEKLIAGGGSRIWMAASSEPALSLDLPQGDDEVRRLLRDPSLSGNRLAGWTVVNGHTESNHRADRVWETIDAREGSKYSSWRLELARDGFLEFTAGLDCLAHDEARALYPLAILEYPTSFLRLVGRILELRGECESEGTVTFDLLLQGVDGWRLWPYSPGVMGWKDELLARPPLEREILTLPSPFEFPVPMLLENPDACAWEVVRTIYFEFGYTQREIPRVFDPDAKRLQLRD